MAIPELDGERIRCVEDRFGRREGRGETRGVGV
jgi:hypothetical protein